MKEISGTDLRASLREAYLSGGISEMPEREVLELFLFYAVSKNEVSAVCERLLAHFDNDIERIFSADTDELCKIEGITPNAAALIHLLNDVSGELQKNENVKIKSLSSLDMRKQYVKNALGNLIHERVIVITMRGDEILGCSTVADGTVNLANIEIIKIMKCILRDKADSIIIAHNHPKGRCAPSDADILFTENLNSTLENVNIKLTDHLIVGSDGVYSISCSDCGDD